jgi:H+-transporting ATPase
MNYTHRHKETPRTISKDSESIPVSELLQNLKSSKNGLTQADAALRISEYGKNQIEEKHTSLFILLLTYLWGPIPWMIEAAGILAAIVQRWPDLIIICILLLSNALIGFWEERQASNAIAALKAKLAVKSLAKRDGKWQSITANDLVPGDVIKLEQGDIVPADVRIIEGADIEVDQSALTGESLPVTLNEGNALYASSVIHRGESIALVYGTGTNTYFGKTTELVETAHTVSHFQKAILKVGNYLIMLAIAMIVLIVVVAFIRKDPLLETMEFSLVLLVAAIPIAMPTVLSVTMAVGAKLLAKKKAIVSRLVAIEELAGVDILCSDKTGTLTKNVLQLGDPFCIEGYKPDDIIIYGALAVDNDRLNAIDTAIVKGVKDIARLESYKIIHFTPFDVANKRTEAKVEDENHEQFSIAMGAPQIILEMSHTSHEINASIQDKVQEFAKRGFRSLGVAKTDDMGNFKFIGILPLFDPPQLQARSTIASAKQMGINIKMITGDHIAIAQETARQLHMGTDILDSKSLSSPDEPESAHDVELIEKADGFAQVYPEQKFHILDTLQKRGHIVGMTGDGVNDAPALKKADCGIAVYGATDAARAAASIVLLAPGLHTVIEAIKESRNIFQRMNSYAMYRITETLRVLLFMTLSILLFNSYPVTAIMIVILALMNDGAILSIAFDNVRYNNKPEAWDMRRILSVSTVLGVAGVASAILLLFLAEKVFLINPEQVQTLIYLKLSIAGHLTMFITRTKGPFWSTRPANILLFAVIGTQIIATLIAVFGIFMAPIGIDWALFIWLYALLWLFINDRAKLFTHWVLDRKQKVD